MSNNQIGELISFWEMLTCGRFKDVCIPTIQRDYTYGAGTDDTDKVLNNLLGGIKRALFNPDEPEMTLNFVYGFTEEGVNYVPLDGQQRLTTLYLLHYYAAIFDAAGDFDTLRRFTYATRETTKQYCASLIDHHKEISDAVARGLGLASAIKDRPWYLPNYDNDPSVRSMQYVFARIEERFADVRAALWSKLTGGQCRVNYYLLDFGPFGLSDDLYVKMNSRGKKLTEYEIFKSMFLKHVEKTLGEKALANQLAMRFDNGWTDLVWETIGKPSDEEGRREIDRAYIRLIRMLLVFLSYRHDMLNDNPQLNQETMANLVDSVDCVNFITDFMEVWVWASHQQGGTTGAVNLVTGELQTIVKNRHTFQGCLRGDNVRYGDMLLLMGEYLGLKHLKENTDTLQEVRRNMRHLRNLIENSDNEIRNNLMPSLLKETEEVMLGLLSARDHVTFNTNQWNEECEKEGHIPEWEQLYQYEEHPLLRGALSNFAPGQNLDLGNSQSLNIILSRLSKFSSLFDNTYEQNDGLIRKAMLTLGDYSQWEGNRQDFRIVGNVAASWRSMFVKSTARKGQETIMRLLDQYNPTGDNATHLQEMVDDYLQNPNTDTTDWRYYVVKYYNYTEGIAYSNGQYGYYWLDHQNSNSLETAILQSSQFGLSNVAWMLLNLILFERNKGCYNLTLYTHAANGDEESVYLNSDQGQMQLAITTEGWGLYCAPGDLLQHVNIPNASYQPEKQRWLIVPDKGADFIEWAEQHILSPLGTIPGLAKTEGGQKRGRN